MSEYLPTIKLQFFLILATRPMKEKALYILTSYVPKSTVEEVKLAEK